MMFGRIPSIVMMISVMTLSGVCAEIARADDVAQDVVLGHAVVPTQIIYPGEVVDGTKIQLVDVTNPNLSSGYAQNEADVIGLVSTRTLLPGRTITLSQLRPPFAVKRGSMVVLVYDQGGLRITANGTPLQDASIGEMVKVRNTDSGIIINGTVMNDGSILVANK